jgi:hypothetical protein
MEQAIVSIPTKEYRELKRHKNVDEELLKDIAQGVKDILQGKITEV